MPVKYKVFPIRILVADILSTHLKKDTILSTFDTYYTNYCEYLLKKG